MWDLKKTEFTDTENKLVVIRGREWGMSKMGDGVQKVQTSNYKINKYQGCKVQHDKYNQHCCMLYMEVVMRVNPKSSHDKEKVFFCFLNFVYI